MAIFYSENCKTILLEGLDIFYSIKLEYRGFKVKVGTKNALDFQLASYFGSLIGQDGTDTNSISFLVIKVLRWWLIFCKSKMSQ